MRTLYRLLLPAVLTLAAGCSRDPLMPSLRDIERHEAVWKAQHLSSYTFTYSVGCFCPTIVNQPATVEVRAGQVVSVTSSTGQPVTAEMRAWWPTVDQVFEQLKAERREGDSRMSIHWDGRLGYPTSVSSTRENVADGDYDLSISEVKPAS